MREVLATLSPRPGETVLDCTAGLGGHAARLGEAVGASGTVVVNDMDPAQAAAARARCEQIPNGPRVVMLAGNFVDAPRRLAEAGLSAGVVLADLGFASNQMSDPSRGLSFQGDAPLDMRLDPTLPASAADLVQSLPEAELAEIIRDFGEERRWRQVARKLVQERGASPIRTTARLAALVRAAVGPEAPGGSRIDPATRTFQALRIAVNDELGSLRSLLESVGRSASARRSGGGVTGGGGSWLAPGARVGIISFHSLEDRLVKHAFGELVDRGLAEHVTRKPLVATEGEVSENPRARSAKLRAIRLAD
ncbi:MAG: 16S rRNA (cytosine(1402)-N(4))-methyltransferase RsmH [Phycisphaerales bacterium]|nr:16S rRNA (cytosine(1402)-N(4))-methyltransferase RsmH [Phycisphaerales bacterium]